MGKRIVITCDKCGKEWNEEEKGEQAVSLTLNVKFGSTAQSTNIYDGNKVYSAVWCRNCIMKHGVYRPINDEDKSITSDKTPTIEDTIINVLNDLGFYQAE